VLASMYWQALKNLLISYGIMHPADDLDFFGFFPYYYLSNFNLIAWLLKYLVIIEVYST